ncbi:hypothetical protein E2C01_081474 [Portunus trituberculatus]|uniref:Uncharacterized protein n=1 Tax=Portunus trituberculatus TaxID=210409 RepID=A0A5B7IWS1_PORTR|nr:hypothetical protein [Portunus trituberculatus]
MPLVYPGADNSAMTPDNGHVTGRKVVAWHARWDEAAADSLR